MDVIVVVVSQLIIFVKEILEAAKNDLGEDPKKLQVESISMIRHY